MAELENQAKDRIVLRRTSSMTSRSDESVKRTNISGPTMSRRVSGVSFTMHSSSHKNRPKNEEGFVWDARKRATKYENSYRMDPKTAFPEIKIRNIVKEALTTLENHKYEPNVSSNHSKFLSQRILDEIRLLNVERYKFVCLVSIGSKTKQDLRMASRCLWDTEHDTFVSESLEKHSFYAVATVYAVYFE